MVLMNQAMQRISDASNEISNIIETIEETEESEEGKEDSEGREDESKEAEENVEKKFGLSTIYERVHLLNGKIDITSEKELGTEITIRVPISKEICDD